jgi:hypothetical protein
MEKSTALGIGLLAVVGVGAYVYLKRKKSTTTTTTTTSSSAVDSSLGLPAVTTTTSVVDTATGATKTTKTDTTSGTAVTTVTNVIDETKTNNYIMAKKISEHIESLLIKIKDLSIKLSGLSGYMANVAYQITEQNKLKSLIRSETALIKTKTAEANALGYKILPYGLIEKM